MGSVEEQAGCVLEDLPFSKDNWTLVLQGRLNLFLMFHKVAQLQENYMTVEYNDICSLQGSHQHITSFDIYLLAICYPIMTKLNISLQFISKMKY